MRQERREVERTIANTIRLHAYGRTPNSKVRTTNLYLGTNVLRKGQEIRAGHLRIPVERDTAFVFADDAPLFNWAHPCRYLLYDARTGDFVNEVNATFPPDLVEENRDLEAFHQPVVHMATKPFRPVERADWATRFGKIKRIQGKRYAVLFSGASNNRHVNDLEFLYRTLVDVYDFDPSRIYVLNYDGTIRYSGWPQPVGNWPGNNTPYTMNVHGAGTRGEFENVLDELKTRLTTNDLLMIHTNNHGGHNGESYLCTYSTTGFTPYGASDFADKLAELPTFAKLMVMMEQCHAGGFMNPVIDASPARETTFAAACEESLSSIGGAEFDPFARDWIAGMTGVDPYGAPLAFNPDADANEVIAAKETFDYANTIRDPYDTPVYLDTPVGCGNTMHLGELPVHVLIQKMHRFMLEVEPIAIEPLPPPPGPDPWFLVQDIKKRVPTLERALEQAFAATATTTKTTTPGTPEHELHRMMGRETTTRQKTIDDVRESLNKLVQAFNELEHV